MFSRYKLHIIFNDHTEMVHKLKKPSILELRRLIKRQDFNVIDFMYLEYRKKSTGYVLDGKPTEDLFKLMDDYPICTKQQQFYSTVESIDTFKETIATLVNAYIDKIFYCEYHAELVDNTGKLPASQLYDIYVNIGNPLITVEVNIEREIPIPNEGQINILRGNNLLLSIETNPKERHYKVTEDLSDLFKSIVTNASH